MPASPSIFLRNWKRRAFLRRLPSAPILLASRLPSSLYPFSSRTSFVNSVKPSSPSPTRKRYGTRATFIIFTLCLPWKRGRERERRHAYKRNTPGSCGRKYRHAHVVIEGWERGRFYAGGTTGTRIEFTILGVQSGCSSYLGPPDAAIQILSLKS